ncbi:MAG: serine/threonine protein kinase, partial [Planctomycetota bacterium]
MRSVAGYAIEGELGRGAMGVVYRGRDPAGRPVALKLLLHTGSRTARERFLREARLCAALDHPHVLRVHGAGEDQGRPYIVYELLPGARPLDARCAPTLRERLLLLRDAARGLGHAHARGIVHRDVKPQNLLVGRDGVVRVADFGIASGTDLERLTLSGALVGTPSHMAPEQVAGQRDALGPTTDVWALGVVLYELVCAELPFVARSLPELAGAVLHGPRPRLPAAEGIPPGLDEVLARCLDRRPERRFPDAVAFADALERVLAGAGEPRRPRRPLLVAGTLLLGVGVGGAAWFLAGGRAVRSAAATAPPPPADATVPAAERADARGRAQAGRPGTTADLPRPSPRPRLPFPQRIFAPYPLDGPLPGESSPWVRELRTRAAGGDARALALLAYCVGGGYGVAPSPDGKLHLLHDAAHRGHPQACTFLGVHALRGQFVEGGSLFEPRPNPAVAARWFRIGAAGGDPLSAWWLLRLIRRGEVAGTRGETEELAARIPPELEPPV